MKSVKWRLLFLVIFVCFGLCPAAWAETAADPAHKDKQDISGNAARKTAAGVAPELIDSLSLKDAAEAPYLAKLSKEEQADLARLVEKRIKAESGALISIMAVVSRFVPAFISASFADNMEPATIAKISDKVSTGKAVAIAEHLEPEFLAEVAKHQDPEKVSAVVAGMSDELLIDVTAVLEEQEEYPVVAKFCDDMPVQRLKMLAEELNHPHSLVRIGAHMEDRDKAATTASLISDDYLLRFMQEICKQKDFELAAKIGKDLAIKRQVRLAKKLDPECAAGLAVYYPPEIILGLMKDTEPSLAHEIGRRLPPEKLAQILNKMEVKTICDTLPHYEAAKIREVLPHIDMARVEEVWPQLDQKTKERLSGLATDYSPLADAIKAAENQKEEPTEPSSAPSSPAGK